MQPLTTVSVWINDQPYAGLTNMVLDVSAYALHWYTNTITIVVTDDAGQQAQDSLVWWVDPTADLTPYEGSTLEKVSND